MKEQDSNPTIKNRHQLVKSVIDKPKPPSRLKVLNNFWLSLVVGLSVTLVAFEWRQEDFHESNEIWCDFESPEMPEMIPITVRKAEKVELSEPLAKKKSISKNFSDFKIVDPFEKKFLEHLGAHNDFDPDNLGNNFGEEDIDDVDISGNPFSIPIKAESMLPLFCDCAHLPTKAEQEACNNEQIQRFLHKNLRYPRREKDLGKEGTAVVNYVVDQNGNVTDVRVENNTESGFKEEAKRVVRTLPCMKPAKQYNQNVAVRYRIPIRFVLRN